MAVGFNSTNLWYGAILVSQDYLIVTNSHAQDETLVTLWHILLIEKFTE